VVGQPRQPPGDPLPVRVVPLADLPDQCRRLRPDAGAPCDGLRGGRGDRRRVDLQDLLGVPFEQRAKRAAGAADAKRDDLLQVQQPLGLRRGDHPPVQVPRGAAQPARIGRAVRVERGDDVGGAAAWGALPCPPFVPAQRRERPAVQLQLALGPQVLLEEPGVLRPAEFVERGEDDLADRRSRLGRPYPRARRAAQLVDQLFPAFVEPSEHGGLRDKFRGRHVVVAGVVRQLPRDAQAFLQGRN
jgi:hypothetical protein